MEHGSLLPMKSVKPLACSFITVTKPISGGVLRFPTNLQLAKPDRFLKKSPDRFQYPNALIIDIPLEKHIFATKLFLR